MYKKLCDKLFKDLLTNKIFSRQMLSWNFKILLEQGTGMGIPWLEINTAKVLSPDKTVVR